MKKKIADLIGRISGCVIVGVIVGIIFGLPNYPTESIGASILILLLLEFGGVL